MQIKVINNSKFEVPRHQTPGSAGLDLRANIDEPIVLKPMKRILVPTGLIMEIPQGLEGQIRGRSGLALNHGITLANGVGTIDNDFRGEVKVILINLGEEDFIINPGDRIAQLVISKYEKIEFKAVKKLENTSRGEGGFGHTNY